LTDATNLFRRVFKNVDEKMEKFEDEGCTATVVFIWKEGEQRFLQAANVGDSEAFLRYNFILVPN
jgi:protein phosphatase